MIIPWKERVSSDVLSALLILFRVYDSADVPLRFVGGCVRDWVCGRTPVDFDFATPLTPLKNVALLKAAGIKVKQTGLAHGTITAIIQGRPFEITTLRQDQEPDGRHATVRYEASWQEDANRRDLTLNGLYMDERGHITDLIDGLADCLAGRIRFIGEPAARIEEDYLRILRLYRFFAHYGRQPLDNTTRYAVREHTQGLQILSKERIYKEVMALLRARILTPTLQMMVADNVWAALKLPPLHVERLPYIDALSTDSDLPLLPPLEKLVILVGANHAQDLQHLCFSKADQLFLTRIADVHISQRHAVYFYGVPMAQSIERLTGIENRHSVEEIKTALDSITPLPPFPLSGGDIQRHYPAYTGKALGDVHRACLNWWLTQTPLPTQAECLTWVRNVVLSH